MVNNWLKGFLDSFKEGETQISEKQYNIFARNLKGTFKNGYIEGYTDKMDGFKYRAYLWDCITGCRYYVEKSKI